MARLIFQIGSNNWQQGGEFAPGSGILHESHHHAYNNIPNTHCYSMYPSRQQKSKRADVEIIELEHDIPIAESISPVSSYRFHSMSESEFNAYQNRLLTQAMDYMDRIEAAEGRPIDLIIAHHSFINPLIMRDAIDKRHVTGKPMPQLICFVHGTALKMFANEKRDDNNEEYPQRFLPMMQREKIFDYTDPNSINTCVAISNEQVNALASIFPEFPGERVIVSPNGYNQSAFHIKQGVYQDRSQILSEFSTMEALIPEANTNLSGCDFDKIVVFCGKFADWKRLDALLHAAQQYENSDQKIATLIIGSGPEADQLKYQTLAYQTLGLKHTYFLGPRGQDELATLFNIADIGCFPSRNEPFGLVFVECMACGTPVIGANSGGPRDFVTAEVGELVPETEDQSELAASLVRSITTSLNDDWKQRKGQGAAEYAQQNFSVAQQCSNLLQEIDRLALAENAKKTAVSL